MAAELVLDRYRRDITTLGGLEQILDSAGNAQPAGFVDFTHVAGPEEAVLGITVSGFLRFFEVAQHLAGALHKDFTGAVGNATDHAAVGMADIADARFAQTGEMRIGHVLAHAVGLEAVRHPGYGTRRWSAAAAVLRRSGRCGRRRAPAV